MILDFGQWCDINTNIQSLSRRLRSSTPEQYVAFYLSKVFKDIEYQKQFSWLDRYSLDMYIPSLSLAIEYDGEFFHSDKFSDSEKTQLCNSNNINIFRIIEKSSDNQQIKKQKYNEISYFYNRTYTNIDIAILELCNLINKIYNLEIHIDIDIKRDRKQILSYIQQKIYKKSIAYVWPESKDYWHENNKSTIFDVFYTDTNRYLLKCPHCQKEFTFHMRYFHNRKSLIPCDCEIKQIENNFKEALKNYNKNGILVTFDNSLESRRLYDRMYSQIKFCLNHSSSEEIRMYEKLGFQHPQLKYYLSLLTEYAQ